MKLGQNFLIDNNIANKIIDLADLNKNENVIEIGPGRGILTERILDKVDQLTAIEIDDRLVDELKTRFSKEVEEKRLILINNDALKADWHQFKTPFTVVSNLPYQISSPILFLLQELGEKVGRMILMLQMEVANRLAANPGTKEYGAITVFLQNDFEITKLFKVSPFVFSPRPEVESVVLSLVRREKPLIDISDKVFFKRVVKGSFGTRRKTLKNALKIAELLSPQEKSKPIDNIAGIDLKRRGETLSLKEFSLLYYFLSK